jgi:hypothetical protein
VQVKTVEARWPFPIVPGGAAGGGSCLAAAMRWTCLWSVPTVASRRRLRGRVLIVGSGRNGPAHCMRPSRFTVRGDWSPGRPTDRLSKGGASFYPSRGTDAMFLVARSSSRPRVTLSA